MADFFILNRKLIENKFSDWFTFEHGERLWNELCELLNASGKAQNDVKKWKKASVNSNQLDSYNFYFFEFLLICILIEVLILPV